MVPMIAGVGASVGGSGGVVGLERGLKRLVAAGCTHAELGATSLYVTIQGRANLPRIARVAEICAAHELKYSVHAPIAINFMEHNHLDLHRAVMRSSIEFCARVSAGVVVIHPGRVHPQADLADRKRLLEIERDEMQRAADFAGQHAVVIGMENLNPNAKMMAGSLTSYALDPRRLAEQIDAINHESVFGVLDFAHGWLAASAGRFDYLEAVHTFAPFVGHLHVTDNCGAPITLVDATDDEHVAYGMGDLHLPIGWGSVPYDLLLPTLNVRPGTRAIHELHGKHLEELETSIAAVHAIARHLNQHPS